MSRIANISLIQLEYLVALDEHRHFIKAAESCFVTQPTLSMQIKKLEEELGVLLFDRSKQPILPTDIGVLVVKQAKEVLNETRRIDNILQEYKGTVKGDIFLGIIPTISPYLMPHLISKLSKTYPELRLHVRELMTHEIIHELEEDHLDVGIVSTPLDSDRIEERPIFYERFCFYFNPKHPAYNNPSTVTKDILLDKMWLLSEGNCFRNQSINLCSLKDQSIRDNMFDYESGSLETLMKIVKMEGGATIIPEWAAIELSETDRQNLRYPTDMKHVREVSLISTRSFAKAKLLEAFHKLLLECVPKKLAQNTDLPVIGIDS